MVKIHFDLKINEVTGKYTVKLFFSLKKQTGTNITKRDNTKYIRPFSIILILIEKLKILQESKYVIL